MGTRPVFTWRAVCLLVTLWGGCALGQPDAGAGMDIDFARHLYAQGEYRLAVEELVRFAAAHPEHPDAQEAAFLAADCWVQLGDWRRARRELEEFLRRYPLSSWADHARVRLAATEFELGAYAHAESLYARIGEDGGEGAGDALYWAGEAAFRRGDAPRAAALLEQAVVRLGPGDTRGWALRRQAEALRRLGREAQARDILTRLASSAEAQPDDVLLLARLLLDAGRPADAEEALTTLARRWPGREDSRLVREVRVRSAWDQGRRAEAISLLSPHPAEAPALLAWMLLEEGQGSAAVNVLVPAMRTLEGRERAEAAVLLASAYRAVGAPASGDSVLAAETAGITDRELLARAIVLRARLQHETGQNAEAKRTLDRGFRHLATGPDSVEGLTLSAQIAAAEGRWADATRDLLDARDHAPEAAARDLTYQALVAAYRAESWDRVERLAATLKGAADDSVAARAAFWKAEAMARQGRWSEAEATYGLALAGLPTARERADAAFGHAWALVSLNRYGEAVDAFTQAAALDPRSETAARAMVRAGDVLMMQGAYRDAAAAYRRASAAITLRDIGDEALLGLGKALSLAGETDEAVAVLDRLFEASPTAAVADDALFEKGEALFRAGRFDDAEAEYRRLLDLHRDRELRDNALYRIGDCQYNRGEYASARTTYLAVVQGYPDSDLWIHAVQGALWAAQQSSGAAHAVALCDSLLERTQDDGKKASLTLAKADLLYGLERYEEALPLYRQLNRPSTDLRAALCVRGRPGEAREAFEGVARRWPDSPEAAEGLYQAAKLARENDPAGARMLLRELLASYPRSDLCHPARFDLGLTFANEPDSALAAWESAAALSEGEWGDRAILALAETHLASGRPDSALARLSVLLQRQTALSPAAHWVAASAHVARGDSAEARRLYLRLAYLFPEDSLAAAASAQARALAPGTGP